MKRIDFDPLYAIRAWRGKRPLQLALMLAIGGTLFAGSAHALPPGELVADAARQTQRMELRRMLSSGTSEDRKEVGSRRLSPEERQSLRRDVRDASRGAYPEQRGGRQKKR